MEAICNSTYVEYILHDLIPQMTSNTSSIGQCIADSNQTTDGVLWGYGQIYYAFDKTIPSDISASYSFSWWTTTRYGTNGNNTAYIGYSFSNKIKCFAVKYILHSGNTSGGIGKFQISNDGETWEDTILVNITLNEQEQSLSDGYIISPLKKELKAFRFLQTSAGDDPNNERLGCYELTVLGR